jgi:hypothetical protein
MSWYTPTVADAKLLGLQNQEVTIITNGLPTGRTITEAIQAAIDAVVSNIRFYITMPGRTPGEDGTIPREATIHFIPLVRRALFGQVTGATAEKLYTEIRTQEALRADEWLKLVASKLGGITAPETPADTQPAGPSVSLVGLTPSAWSAESMNGL